MGGCCAAEQKSNVLPDLTCGLDDELFLPRPVLMATLGPEGTVNDITATLRSLYSQGENYLGSGIRAAVGNPYPNSEQKVLLKVWFLPLQPDAVWEDTGFGEEPKEFALRGLVAYATYGPGDASSHEVTESIKDLAKVGRTSFKPAPPAKKGGFSGLRDYIGDAFPAQKCVARFWYRT